MPKLISKYSFCYFSQMCDSSKDNKKTYKKELLNELSNNVMPYYTRQNSSNKSVVIDLLAYRIKELNKKIESLTETKIILTNKTKTLKEIINKLNLILKEHTDFSSIEATKKRNIIIGINDKVKELILKSKESVLKTKAFTFHTKTERDNPSPKTKLVVLGQGDNKIGWILKSSGILFIYLVWTWMLNHSF
eukprot:GAHX01001043.1.p1 GENE.GAHX01001043.1~~GAHX01001043.1.p1  ORF type:complete len:191 (+),score=39.41 GAHX01001043.1:370-942(+)